MRGLAAHKNKTLSPPLGVDASVDVQVRPRDTFFVPRNEDNIAECHAPSFLWWETKCIDATFFNHSSPSRLDRDECLL